MSDSTYEVYLKINRVRQALDALAAEIDMLMMEYCPNEITDEQMAEWEKHQVVVHKPKLKINVEEK